MSAFDPKRTLAVHCGNGFDAGFQPLSKYSIKPIRCRLLSLGADMKRRDFIMLIGGAALARPVAAQAQRPARIGFLGFGTAAATADRVEALRAGLRDLGYLEGKNIVIDFRWAEVVDRLRELAAELVRENVDVIFATSSTEVEVARQATTTIPIVFSTHFDPVGIGHVSSLARPGGNITGLAALQTEFTGRHWRC
jgi:putative ABC transport system substrate-binding protein